MTNLEEKLPLVLVEWLDSHSGRGWQDLDDLKDNCAPLHVRSVGWLLNTKNGHKMLVSSISGEKDGVRPHGLGDITIPVKSIRKITVLRKGTR